MVGLRDHELLDLLVRLELVQEPYLLERQAHLLGEPEVDVRLPNVAHEGPLQLFPELVQIVDVVPVDRLGVVAAEEGGDVPIVGAVGGVLPEGADADRLDLHHVPVEDHDRRVAHSPVLVPPDKVVAGFEGDLHVLPDVHDARDDAPSRDDVRLEALMLPLSADPALPGPPELLRLAHPVLPLPVNLVSLVEDVLQDEREGLVEDLAGLQPVVGSPGAPVGLGHLRRVDVVVPVRVPAACRG